MSNDRLVERIDAALSERVACGGGSDRYKVGGAARELLQEARDALTGTTDRTGAERPVATYLCGPTPDPDDPLMEYDNYFGRVPRDFNPNTGLSRTHIQVLDPDTGRWKWKER